VCGLKRPLFNVSGSCVAMDLQLEMEQLSFGQATLNSRITRPLMLQNLGDIPSTWRLDKSSIAPDFSVSPTEGYLQPNEDTNIEVTFHPASVNRDIRYERVPIYVDGQPPLALTLTGMCVNASAEPTALVFKSQVRQPTTQSVQIKNTTSGPWRILPAVSNEQWSGAESLEIPAGGTGTYAITFCPTSMTKKDAEGVMQPHRGNAFFPLPDGTAILYSLEGTAEAPSAAGAITKALPCKQLHVVPLLVPNWLKQPQRFRVDIRVATKDVSTTLKGHETLDVPASLEREYALQFYAFKEGVTTAEVHFINDKTGEYLFYTLSLTAQAAGVLQRIPMQAPLRQLSTHMLPLHNPLADPVAFTASVANPEVAVPPSFTVQPNGKAEFPIQWRPLLPKETVSQLTLTSAELGTFLYDLQLQALPAGETRTLQFKVALGNPQTLRFRFTAFLKRPETYKCVVGTPGGDFNVEASVAAPAAEGTNGTEVFVDVTFEPSKMGESQDTLTISSAEGGEYTCVLKGTALPPRPQGPILIKAGATAQVSFKNVFTANGDFTVVCDPPALFTVAKPKETVPAKSKISVPVTYKPATGASGKVSGKLTISGPEGFTQLYYLMGEP